MDVVGGNRPSGRSLVVSAVKGRRFNVGQLMDVKWGGFLRVFPFFKVCELKNSNLICLTGKRSLNTLKSNCHEIRILKY